jgi:SAM-dependent methyltransferase
MEAQTQRRQTDEFLLGEGDKWFSRNIGGLWKGQGDVLTNVISSLGLKPKKILEIGCADGWRLDLLAKSTGASGYGIEPSEQAVNAGKSRFPELDLRVGTADHLPFEDKTFDLVIFGFCACLIDPELQLRCVAEADRCLADGGFLAILDFQSAIPFHNNYHHLAGLKTYKMDYSRYFLAHPAYSLVHRQLMQRDTNFLDYNQRQGVDLLIKDMARAFPFNPFASAETR